MKNHQKSVNNVLYSLTDGFVCLYFLVIFLLGTLLVTIAMSSSINRLKTEINVKKADEYLMEEAAVMAFVKCELMNERLTDGDYEEHGVSFHVSLTNNGASVTVFDPLPQVITVQFASDDVHIYDYSVIRSETPA